MQVKFFLLLLLVNSYFCVVYSKTDKVANKTQELAVIQKKIKQINQKINVIKTQKKSLIYELKKLDTKYGNSVLLSKELRRQINKLHSTVKNNQEKITKKRRQINSQKSALKNQVISAFRMGNNKKLKLILNQTNPVLSSRIMVYYQYFNQARLNKISKIKQDLLILQTLENKQIIEQKLLSDKLEKSKLQHSILLQTKRNRKTLLAKINRQFLTKKQQLNLFKDDKKRIKNLILYLQQMADYTPLNSGTDKTFSELKGSLPWPLKGKVIKRFGEKRSGGSWDGVLIKATEGTNIRAVTRGSVVYADWLRGYGLLIIIDHGESYMTLYAFNQSLYKSAGDWVEAGNIIATAGQSGGQTDSGLYFGVRKKAKPINPVAWCIKILNWKIE